MTTVEAEYIRDLDANEQFVDACLVHRNLCSAAGVSIKTDRPFTFADVEEALSRFQKNHKQLQVTIKRLPGKPAPAGWNPLNWIKTPKPIPKVEYWKAPDATIPFQWIRLKSNESWQRAVIESGIQATFEEGELLWRAYYIDQSGTVSSESQEGTFAFVCHTAITDHRGLYFLLDYFMEEFDNVLKRIPFTQKETKMLLPMMDTMDEHYNQANTWPETLKIGLYMASCMMVSARSIYIARNPTPIVPDFTTRHILFNIPKELSSKVLKKLQENNISIRGLVTAAGLAAFHELVRTSKDEVLKIWTTHEMNTRTFDKYFDELKGRIDGCRCNYLETPIETKAVKNSSELWELAKTAHAHVTPQLSSQFQAKLCKFFQQMGSPYGVFSDLGFKNVVRNDFAVAVFDDLDDIFAPREILQVNNPFGTVSAHCMGAPFTFLVQIFKGQIYFTLVYFGNYDKRGQAKEVGEKTLSYLQLAAE